ncbi:MAG: peptidoglycan-binding domain-containing protein [Candidatus Jorgensenbacteria bacterium]|nr:peptidoglycan-binding domain-containing protein [Candidatus Jorgensenbacteria bacterium]
MKRFLVIGFAVVLIFAGVVIPAKGQAQTSDLSSQIQALMAQLKLLQAKVDSQNSQSGSSSGSSASSDSITSVTTSCDTSGFSGLKKGSSSSAVSKLQKILNDNGYLSAKPTGYFGSMTQIALKSFQDENGLGVSGMVDSATLKALGGLSSCVTQSSGSDVSSTSDNSSSNSSASGSASLDSSSATSGGSETELAKKKPSSSVSIVNPSGGETFTVGDKIGLTYKPSKIGDQFVVRISTSDVKGGYEYTLGNVKSYSTAYANKEAFKIPTNVIPASYTLSMTQTGLCEKTYSCAIARTQSFTVISSKIITSTSTTPTITSIYPTTAKIGDTVTVYGTNFTEGASVVFLKTSVGAWAKVLSSSQLTFVVPPGVGSDVIQVLLGGGVGSNVVSISILIESNSATPYITDIKPSQGTINNTIAIYGNNIYGVVKSIEFVSGNGNILATLSGSDISAASPAGFLITKSLMDLLGYSGTFWIDVVTSNGTSNKVAFTLTYPNTKSMPSISSISPTSGTSGTSVTIYGTNLSGTSNVEFYNSNNSLAATIFPSSVSANSVVFTVASIFAANVEPGTYQLGVVTNACQGGCNSNRFNFTLNALQSDAPKITSVNPVRGDIDTAVTINGTNLAYVYAVEFYSGGVLKTTITSNNISFSTNSTTDSVQFTMADDVILKLTDEVLKLQGSGSSQYYDIRVIAKGTGYSNLSSFTLIPTPIISVTPTVTLTSPQSGSYMPMRSITAKWNQNVNGSIKIYLTTDSGYQQEQQSTQGTAGSNSAIFSPNVDPGVYKLNVCLSTDNWQSQACEYSTGNIIIQPAIIKPDNSQIQASIIEQLNYMMDVLKKMQTSR